MGTNKDKRRHSSGRVAASAAIAAGIFGMGVAGSTEAAGSVANTPALAGRLVAVSGNRLTIQTQSGKSSITTASTTAFYEVAAGSVHTLAIGETLAISPRPTSVKVAGSVTIAASNGHVVAFVMQGSAAGGPGGTGTPPTGSPPAGNPGAGGAGSPPTGSPPAGSPWRRCRKPGRDWDGRGADAHVHYRARSRGRSDHDDA